MSTGSAAFRASVDQNPCLPPGGTEAHAGITVTAEGPGADGDVGPGGGGRGLPMSDEHR